MGLLGPDRAHDGPLSVGLAQQLDPHRAAHGRLAAVGADQQPRGQRAAIDQLDPLELTADIE